MKTLEERLAKALRKIAGDPAVKSLDDVEQAALVTARRVQKKEKKRARVRAVMQEAGVTKAVAKAIVRADRRLLRLQKAVGRLEANAAPVDRVGDGRVELPPQVFRDPRTGQVLAKATDAGRVADHRAMDESEIRAANVARARGSL